MDKDTLENIVPDPVKRDRLLSQLEDFLSIVESTFSGGFLDIFPGYDELCTMRDDLYDLMPTASDESEARGG